MSDVVRIACVCMCVCVRVCVCACARVRVCVAQFRDAEPSNSNTQACYWRQATRRRSGHAKLARAHFDTLRGLRPQVAHRRDAVAISSGDWDADALIAVILLDAFYAGEPTLQVRMASGSNGGDSRSSLARVARAAAGPRSGAPQPGRLHQLAALPGTPHPARSHARSRR